MAEYSSLKVPELKKLLAEKGLAQTGNKADLIARLQENDKKAATEADAPGTLSPCDSPRVRDDRAQPNAPIPTIHHTDAVTADTKEDEISYSDDEAPAEPAAPVEAPVTEAPVVEAPAATEPVQEATEEKPVETEEKPAEPAQSYAIGLASTAADDEAKKRADRAKRFGLEEDDDAVKRADRAKRFGLDEKELASSLDSALPERSARRGRSRGGAAQEHDGRINKRQNTDRRNGGRRQGRGGRDGGRGGGSRRDAGPRRIILSDPTEKAKAEKRAARFATN
jgi:SAP domain-containing ribonucleoprotein